MTGNFYKDFEDKFRGSEEIIKDRLRVYLPFIEPLKEIYPDVAALDLGCGRGEWLELLGENGFLGRGVDLDEEMLAVCQGRDLCVEKGDAVSFLQKLEDESQAVVSAFHLAEHLPFDDLLLLVAESFRVLKPAGILILETPNPENIVVGSSSFYIDPMHHRPLHGELLRFVVERSGFARIKSLGLQEKEELDSRKILSLQSVLNGVSRDYSIVALKDAESTLLEKFFSVFALKYGRNLADVVARYDAALRKNIVDSINPLKNKIGTLESEIKRLDLLELNLSRNEQLKNSLANELAAIYVCRSWRCTKPLRSVMHGFRRLKKAKKEKKLTLEAVCSRFKSLGLVPVHKLLGSRFFRIKILGYLNRYPKLKESLKKIFIKYFLRYIGVLDVNKSGLGYKTSETYKKLINYVSAKDHLNSDLNQESIAFTIALRENKLITDEQDLKPVNYRNRVIACYLAQLRRYPSEYDIVMWSEQLSRGAAVSTILNSLELSPEYKQSGTYLLESKGR